MASSLPSGREEDVTGFVLVQFRVSVMGTEEPAACPVGGRAREKCFEVDAWQSAQHGRTARETTRGNGSTLSATCVLLTPQCQLM
ncbi:hypothetical protein E2562_013713 [Oryza meyeriana var. granulata]|uniref:Uncharacterized protein n=1 Tax=Oryza meyeriana var. granulata TaxID=110450 RepID=A0A6G1BKM4_9ORYZ|nr:hypothetical protein E2562_013713 [Oryza meyeriana var. granulata]